MMKDKIMSSCSNILMLNRDNNSRPQCSRECREALMSMAGSRYGRTQQCCDCEHDEMTPMERRQCQQRRRNFEICGMRPMRDVSTPFC